MSEICPSPSATLRGFRATCSYLKAPFGGKWLAPLAFDTPERCAQGLVIVLSGIEGVSSINHSLIHGLVDAGVPYGIHLHDWTLGAKPAVVNLWLKGRTRRVAASLAELIIDYQNRYPQNPVNLIGHSGGAALIPFVLNELPPERAIANGIMIAPALSPQYDLSDALKKVTGKLVNVRSRWDWYFLGVGTTLVGTLDRRYGHAAGNVGFRKPGHEETCLRSQLYRERFREIRYRLSMLKDWHYGGHLSCLNRVFIERHISPLLGNFSASAEAIEPASSLSLPYSQGDLLREASHSA